MPAQGKTMTEDINEQAAYWHSVQYGDDMDWHAYTAWLEADPRHRAAFDAVALLDDDIMAQRDRIADRLAQTPKPRTRRWPWIVATGGAVAAALAVTIALPRAAPDTVWQSDAAIRTIAFEDGSQAILAP